MGFTVKPTHARRHELVELSSQQTMISNPRSKKVNIILKSRGIKNIICNKFHRQTCSFDGVNVGISFIRQIRMFQKLYKSRDGVKRGGQLVICDANELCLLPRRLFCSVLLRDDLPHVVFRLNHFGKRLT